MFTAQGDLKSVVLHDMEIKHVKSSFPMALGAWSNFFFIFN
jgi:hypothetical protein